MRNIDDRIGNKGMQKKKTWVKFRHKAATQLFRPIINCIAAARYHIRVERFAQEGKRNWLVLSNHQTDFDQFFIGMAFRRPVYYVAMEDVFSNGLISRIIEWLVAPIPIMKARSDMKAVRTCAQVAREGGNIALFPEGNRTYSGRTCCISPAVASLAKLLRLPIAIFRIEGGYGVKPRWADTCRKGDMKAGVRRIIEPEEYQNLSRDELYELICRELWVNEAVEGGSYVGKNMAEGLERVLYICPDCGPSEFETDNDILTCRKCGRRHKYLPNKQLQALDGPDSFRYVADWYDYQESYIRKMDLSSCQSAPIFSDTANLMEIIVFKKKLLRMKDALIRIFADHLEIGNGQEQMNMAYADIKAMACIAGHKLNIFHGDRVFQIRGGKSFNALKYCNIFYHAKYLKEEHTDGEFQFLGL